MNYLARIISIFSDTDKVVALANACDKAYAVGTGNPDWHKPFGIENPELLAQNLAAAAALNTGISILAAFNCLCPDFDSTNAMVPKIIASICEEKSTDLEKGILLRLANCSWNAGQPFRAIVNNPLSKVKGMNMFDILLKEKPEEIPKDWHQIKAAALFYKAELGL